VAETGKARVPAGHKEEKKNEVVNTQRNKATVGVSAT